MEADKKDTKHSKIKLLDRKERVDIFSGAAKVGQLTRLDEYVVEQVAGPREVETHHHDSGSRRIGENETAQASCN
jgi:hypothetical protein